MIRLLQNEVKKYSNRNGVVILSKVAMMTWFQYHNYGTALQVVALSNVIRQIGHDVTIINYKAKGNPIVLKNGDVIAELCAKAVSLIKNHGFRSYNNNERKKRFLAFYDSFLAISKPCNLLSELQMLNEEYDAFVCGSDQIWSPACFDSHYFLDFVSDDNKKIAYAPSVGLLSIEDKYIREQIKQLTKKIGFLSTREENGSKIIHSLCGRDVKTVLDPTLLLGAEKWKAFYSDGLIREEKPYMLVYVLGKNEWQWKEIYRIADELGLAVKIIPVFEKDLDRQGCIKIAVGPEEFLAYIHKADYVCTDSFHGLAFSINFHKPFTVFERFKAKDKINQNERIYNLLDQLHLRSRLFKDKSSYEMLNEEVDYDDVDKKRQALVDDSIEYLTASLSKATTSIPKAVKNNIHKNNTLCCGCGACKAVCPCNAIEVKLNKDGFYTASVDDKKCVSCGKCANVCPYVIDREDRLITDSTLYSFKSKSKDVLKKSSSGGAAHHIASLLCENGYAVAGCTFDIDSQTAKHILIEPKHLDDLSQLQGSKYMQSNFADISQQLNSITSPLVIFGTPCQIAGARSLLKKRDDIIYVDLICHGVPSYNLYKKYQEYLRLKGFNISKLKIVFRNKKYGWHKRYITLSDDITEQSFHQDKDPFFLSFEQCHCFSHACYECPWRDKSAANVRIGDYWGDKFQNDEIGVSEVIIMDEVGQRLLSRIIESETADIKLQDVHDYQLFQQTVNGREPVFWKHYICAMNQNNLEMKKIIKTYVIPFARRKKIRRRAKKIIHIVKGKR